MEATPPAAPNGLAEKPLGELPAETPTPAISLADAPLVDSVFAEMTSPLLDETIASEPPATGSTPLTSFADLELEAPPMKAKSASEPREPVMVEDEAAMEVIDEAVEDEAPVEVADEAIFEELVSEEAIVEEEDVEVVDEADAEEMQAPTEASKGKKPARLDAEEPEVAEEEGESEPEGKTPARKKKSKKLLLGCLGGCLGVLLLGCGGVGFVGYRFLNGSIADSDWQTVSIPEAQCSISMPGNPVVSVEPQAGIQLHKYLVEKTLAHSEFLLLYYDLPFGAAPPNILEEMLKEESKNLQSKLSAKLVSQQPIKLGSHQGREGVLELAGGRKAFIRFYFVPQAGKSRVYELLASGPKMETTSGPGAKFFNSFQILSSPSAPLGAGPNPKPNPMPRPGGNPKNR